ncbi:hypothetical protein DXG01_007589 [Tephrocybe rancida]|nr:hypothetical protein DXG01_007589 [Tephrocybe rancida]
MTQWELQQNAGNGQWTIRNVKVKTYLGIEEGHLQDGLRLCAVESAVAWDISRDGKDQSVNRISVPGSQYNVDLTNNGDAKNGTVIALWTKWGDGVNQTWRFHMGE